MLFHSLYAQKSPLLQKNLLLYIVYGQSDCLFKPFLLARIYSAEDLTHLLHDTAPQFPSSSLLPSAIPISNLKLF